LLGLLDAIMEQPDRPGEEDIPNVHDAIPWFYSEYAHALSDIAQFKFDV
jgi:hypothetical protein